jgi:hypothetical protein
MPIDPRRCASLLAAATLLAGLVLNVVAGPGAEALTGSLGAAAAPSPSTSSTLEPAGTPVATTATTSPTPTPTATPTPTPTATPLPEPVATALSSRSGGTAARRTVWMHGRAMANVARVVVGNQDAQQLTLLSPTELRLVIPEAEDFAPGSVAISLISATDHAWIATPYRWTYAVRSAVDREMRYAATNWDQHASARFGYIPKNDCVNFTSQLLVARGWHESAVWWNDGPVSRTVTSKKTVEVPTKVTITTTVTVKGKPVKQHTVKTVQKKVRKTVKKAVTTVDASAPWVSSTAMSAWLASRHDLASHLSYAQRAAVRVGDIVQFNWSGAGSSWDHTAVVSKIVIERNGAQHIWYAEHTNHQLYGGSIGALMRLPGYTHMRVQFWHLRH